ncbi:hypothetical protein AYI68_g7345 [Smittium mucronatum]|uniref:Uncharacterized protein n=1 Tax=Smittium mucronatum TaxID=133383 RepID=A0A1R0GNY3_9FUNG|nr:hypothetical protein AYI68_g7345 [Smittium mucronatum]
MDLPGKPIQFVPYDFKPLMDQEDMYTLISKKPAVKSQRVQPFRKRQQNTFQRDAYSSITVTAPNNNAETTAEQTAHVRPTDRASNFQGRVEKGFRITFKNQEPPRSKPSSIQKKAESRSLQSSSRRGFVLPGQASNRVNSTEGSSILYSAFQDTQEDWRSTPRTRSPKVKSPCGGAKLQDENAELHMPYDPIEVLLHFLRSTGCLHAYSNIQEVQEVSAILLERLLLSVPRPSIRTIHKSINIHKDSPSSFRMVEIERNEDIRVSGRLPDYGRKQGSVFERNTQGILQALRAWTQDQRRKFIYVPVPINHPSRNGDKYQRNDSESSLKQDSGSSTRSQQTSELWENDIEMSGELYRESPVDVGGTSSYKTNALPTSGAQEPLSFYTEFMDFDGDPDEVSNRQSIILEERAEVMKWSLFLAGNSRNGDIYRLQGHRMGSCNRQLDVLGILEKIGGEDADQRQGTFDRTIRPENKRRGRKISVSLLIQHNNTILCEEVWRSNLYETTWNCREILVALPQDQH